MKSVIAHYFHLDVQGEAKVGLQLWICEHSLFFMCCYLLMLVLFSIQTTVNLPLPHPVYTVYMPDGLLHILKIWGVGMENVFHPRIRSRLPCFYKKNTFYFQTT